MSTALPVPQTPSVPQALGISPALYPFESHRFDLDGLAYHYIDEGAGDPVVMVHGNPTWSFYFRELAKDLRDDYRVIVPDHIGCGLSDKPDDTRYRYTLAQRVDDLEAFLEHLDLGDRITLVAHDWGGMIAMAYAVRHPERVRRLVLMNTAAFPLPKTKRLPFSLWFVRNTPLGAFMVRRFNLFSRGATWMAVKRPLSKEIRDAYCAPYDSYENRIATLRFVEDIPLSPADPSYQVVAEVEKQLDRFLETPVLLLWGEKDFVFDHHFRAEFERHWPHAEVHSYPRAGHYVLEDAADEIVPTVRDFLARHPI